MGGGHLRFKNTWLLHSFCCTCYNERAPDRLLTHTGSLHSVYLVQESYMEASKFFNVHFSQSQWRFTCDPLQQLLKVPTMHQGEATGVIFHFNSNLLWNFLTHRTYYPFRLYLCLKRNHMLC